MPPVERDRDTTMNADTAGSRSGIALVIVLGLMSVMVVLAIAFITGMRTERLAARNYKDTTVAREMIHVGLTRAAIDLDNDQYTNRWMYLNLSSEAFPSKPIPDLAVNKSICSDIVTEYGRSNMPLSLWASALPVANSVRWAHIRENGTAGRAIGRYAYLAVNCSGFLDANRQHDNYPVVNVRMYGSNCNEVAWGQPDIATVFPELRNGYGDRLARGRMDGSVRTYGTGPRQFRRAETVPDLWIAGRYGYDANYPLNLFPQNLFVFSHFPSGGWYDSGTIQTQICVGGNITTITRDRASIAQEFSRMFTRASIAPHAGDADFAARNLEDYLDSDYIPGGVNGGLLAVGANCNNFCTEPVPMINEIAIHSELTSGDPGRITINYMIELWYPFEGVTNPNSYEVCISSALVGQGYGPLDRATARANGPWTRSRYEPVRLRQTARLQTNMPLRIDFSEIAVRTTGDEGAPFVDRVTGGGVGSPTVIQMPWSTYMSDSTARPAYTEWQVNDPRINFHMKPDNPPGTSWSRSARPESAWRLARNPKQEAAPSSLGRQNDGIPGEFTRPGAPGFMEMHVRNRDNLTVLGEMGLLLFSATRPWQTIALIDPPANQGLERALRVYDHFNVSTNTQRGIVNLNTFNAPSLASIFVNEPVQRWPGEGGTAPTRLSTAQALALGREIIARRRMYPGGLTNRSDIAILRDAFTGVLGSYDEPQLEGIVRNSGQLFDTRQNLFLVYLAGQAVQDNNRDGIADLDPYDRQDVVLANQRALALLWRDPWPDAQGRNKCFIRWFRWMEE